MHPHTYKPLPSELGALCLSADSVRSYAVLLYHCMYEFTADVRWPKVRTSIRSAELETDITAPSHPISSHPIPSHLIAPQTPCVMPLASDAV
jgi:hypothetical protein